MLSKKFLATFNEKILDNYWLNITITKLKWYKFSVKKSK